MLSTDLNGRFRSSPNFSVNSSKSAGGDKVNKSSGSVKKSRPFANWRGWDLDGKGSDVAVEEIELAIEEIKRGP